MTEISSQLGIVFLSPEQLIGAIAHLEYTYPGYWWSVSQQIGRVTVSLCPTVYCPYPVDKLFARTSRGDRGFICSFNLIPHDPDGFDGFRDLIDHHVRRYRQKIRTDYRLENNIATDQSYRHQTQGNLESLQNAYRKFLTGVKAVEDKNHRITEVYVGSCELSVDCSIRGKRADKSKFDFSADLQNHAILADALAFAYTELLYDVSLA